MEGWGWEWGLKLQPRPLSSPASLSALYSLHLETGSRFKGLQLVLQAWSGKWPYSFFPFLSFAILSSSLFYSLPLSSHFLSLPFPLSFILITPLLSSPLLCDPFLFSLLILPLYPYPSISPPSAPYQWHTHTHTHWEAHMALTCNAFSHGPPGTRSGTPH